MYKNTIFKPLACHLEDFFLLNDCDPFLATALADNMFPTVLLKIVGGMEQKIKEIRWQLANVDIMYRRELLKVKYNDSFENKDVVSLYEDIHTVCNALNKCKIFEENYKFYKVAYSTIYCLFETINYVHTSHKNYFESFVTEYRLNFIHNNKVAMKKHLLQKISNSRKENTPAKIKTFLRTTMNSYPVNERQKCKDLFLWKSPVGKIFDSAIKARHSFAHNTYSYQARHSSLAILAKSSHPENFFMYFFALIYVDLCLMHYAAKAFESHTLRAHS